MTTFGRLVALMSPYRRWIAAGALLGFVAVGANIALMATSAYLISRAALVTNVADVALAITAVRVLAIGRASFRYLERYVTHRATFDILAGLRVWFYRSIEPLAPARLVEHRSGDLLARIVADIDTLEDFYVRVVVPPIVAALVTLFGSLLLGAFDVVLGVVLLAFLGLTGVILPVASRRLSRLPAGAFIATRAELSAMLVDEVQGIADLVALDRADGHRARVLALGLELDRIQGRLVLVRAGTSALAVTFASLAGVTVLAVGVDLVSAGRLDAVYLALLPLAAVASFEVIGPLAQAVQLIDTNEAAARRLFELIDATPDVVDRPGLEPDARPGPASRASDTSIDIRGLRFRYGPGQPVALDGLDLLVPSGTAVAIVGPSGAGKSTLVNLLLRFWDYAEGEIRIGGRELHDMPIDDVRRMLGVVSQDVHLFNGTIRDNLALADPDVTDEQVVAACRLIGLDEFVESLPDRYQTLIGENGLLLSGGQRQRLAIARVIVKDAPILILDEATANLDVLAERELMDSIAPFMAGRTALVISHRAAVADRVGRALTLDAGRVAGG
jgi:ATP-binding cassette, subfamily C, bacterial CydC